MYFYTQNNVLWTKCHNCGWAGHFGTFLKDFDSERYQQYVYERFSQGEGGRPNAHANATPFLKQEDPIFKKESPFGLTPLSLLPEDNEAVQYCIKRQIPREQWGRLLFLEHTKDIVKLFPQYDTLSKSEEPRLAIPFESFHDEGGIAMSWTGMALRALRGEELRYINVRDEDATKPLIFGLSALDRNKPIMVLEGPIDSLFLPNAIAVAGTGFGKLETLDLPKDQLTIIFDNEPRNCEICKLMERYILKEYKVCIWPSNIVEKDINEMILSGRSSETIAHIIKTHTCKSLTAQLKFVEWKKC